MRVALLLAAIIVSAQAECTSNAFVCKLKEIGSAIKDTTVNLGGHLVTVGKAILGDLVSKGSELLLQGSKAIMGKLNNHLAGVGKREIQLPQQVLDIVEEGTIYLRTLGEDLKGKFQTAILKLIDLSKEVVSLDLTRKLTDDVDTTVAVFKDDAAAAFTLIKTGIKNFLRRVVGHMQTTSKRDETLQALSDWTLMAQLKSAIEALTPQYQTVVGHLSTLGKLVRDQADAFIDKLKQFATDHSNQEDDLFSTADSIGQILITSGMDTLEAAKDTVSQIAAQALDKAKDTLAGSARDALGEIITQAIKSGSAKMTFRG